MCVKKLVKIPESYGVVIAYVVVIGWSVFTESYACEGPASEKEESYDQNYGRARGESSADIPGLIEPVLSGAGKLLGRRRLRDSRVGG